MVGGTLALCALEVPFRPGRSWVAHPWRREQVGGPSLTPALNLAAENVPSRGQRSPEQLGRDAADFREGVGAAGGGMFAGAKRPEGVVTSPLTG